MLDPEIEFHRFFNRENFTYDELLKHPAKLDLDTIDPFFAGNLREIKRLINEMFARNTSVIDTPFGGVTLHLDYIARPQAPVLRFASAISFTHSGFFFVGLTYDLLELMNDICGALSLSSLTSALLGITADTPEKRIVLFACLFLVQIQFAIDHELGHHVHGHSSMRRLNFFSSEEPLELVLGPRGNLDQQAREVEADGYAIHMMAKNIFTGDTASHLRQRLGPTTLSAEAFLVRFLLLSVASYLFLKPEQAFDETKVRAPRHPFGLMRLNVVMIDFRGWAEQFKHDALPHINQSALTEVGSAILAAIPRPETQIAWNAQRTFLESTEGDIYRQELYAARELLRGQMSSSAWKVGE